MRTTATVAAVLPLLLLGAGCSAEPERPRDARPVAIATTSSDVPLTPQSAARAFTLWTVNDDLARASGDERLALAWAADSQRAVTAAEYRKAAAAGVPVARHSYGRPTLWVPRLDGYPQWFVASAPRGRETALMAFVRSSAEARWRLSLLAVPDRGVKPPKVEIDADGYAAALPPEDQSVLIAPSLVAPPQAAVAEDGPGSYSARVLKAGPYTTGYYTEKEKAAKKAAKEGLAYTSMFTATSQPVFPLRTEDGGCLVLYSLTRDVSLTQKEEGPLDVPGELAHLAAGELTGRELHVFSSLRFAALVPAKASSPDKTDKSEKDAKSDKSDKQEKERQKVAVIAEDGTATRIESS
ncbi:hypothetical protein [Actinocorallia populi]|uniref:hypothetical protein n=1 Tax=Actinocorallia populi TaxID=2079200 RepID=UPI001300425E|nr:hypothetical protein [Actinocorallia populi]